MDMRDGASEIHHRLCVTFHYPISYFHALDPFCELVGSLLPHRTHNADSGTVFKVPRIQAILRAIQAGRGTLNLDFLADLRVEEARAWLERLPGMERKTSAAVLGFSTRCRPALLVDSYCHRVAARTGLIPASLPVGPSHRVLATQLPTDWDAQQICDHHEVLMLHGQRCCLLRKPACVRWPLLDLCPAGRGLHGAATREASVSSPV